MTKVKGINLILYLIKAVLGYHLKFYSKWNSSIKALASDAFFTLSADPCEYLIHSDKMLSINLTRVGKVCSFGVPDNYINLKVFICLNNTILITTFPRFICERVFGLNITHS